ncbi:MAG: FtsQ-type POTRA domain-containing protein [Bacillota bacterium]|nr:FtsQ-type POTRA domain-containing protein [Bacillota bacterium]
MSKPGKRKRRKKRPMLVLFIIIGLIVAAFVVANLSCFDIKAIVVIGNDEITDEEVISLSDTQVGDSIFSANPIIVKNRIEKNLYIDTVKVRWNMPNEVEITVKEKECLAQFKMGKKFVVTDRDGKVIDISKEERRATLVDDLEVTSAVPDKMIQVKDENTLAKALELIKITYNNDLFFKKIVIHENRVEAYVYDELVCKGKYKAFVSCIESNNLKSVIYDLYQKDTKKGSINVYSNNYCFFTRDK